MANGAYPVTSEDLTRLGRVIHNLTQQLRQLDQIIRKRAFNIDPDVFHRLETIFMELERIAPRVSEQSNELEQLRTLVDITGIVNSSLDLDVALQSVMNTVLSLTGAQRGYIMLRNSATDTLEVRLAHGMDDEEPDEDTLSVSQSIVEEALRTGEPVLTTNAQHDPRFQDARSVFGFSLRSILCVPLVYKGEPRGVVYVDNRVKDGIFGKKEMQLLTAVASQATLAIENARLFEQARSTLYEITQIKTLLDNILASIVSGVLTTDADDLITVYNTSAEQIFGVPEAQIVGQYFDQSLPEIHAQLREAWQEIRAEYRSVTLESEVALGARVRSLNFKLSPLRDEADLMHGIALVVDDQTELKRRDRMLQAVRRYLPPAMVDNIRSIERIGLAGERREISVLFVETRPFDTFPASLKAGELMQLLNLYMTVGTEAIHRRAGVIDKYVGSEIMALFNSQLNPSPTHAWDAVRAAIDMALDFQDLYTQLGETPRLPYYRIGIHSGEATLGNVGSTHRREFSAIGDTVNLTKRLQETPQLAS
ncbi:MAG: GAF domain-containing protein [Anaerolineae bacterium]|nr:GAF domain-containing protein [Anaerolineae bacterium]